MDNYIVMCIREDVKRLNNYAYLTQHNIILEFGFCDAEMTSGIFSNYSWSEIEAGTTASLPCELGPMVLNGMARRTCNPDTAEWELVSLDECFTSELVLCIVFLYIIMVSFDNSCCD